MAKKEGGGDETGEKEGQNLLGEPTFQKLENGRFKCVETGHELPAHARDSYARSKHCRLGLIDAALASKKPPLNMFTQDPLSKSKLKCKLTGLTVNKSEEHIWKHINGKRFLRMLEKKEAEQDMPDRMVEEKIEQQVQEKTKKKDSSLKKKKKEKAENATNIISEMRDSPGNDSDLEEADFWMPPVGDRWDFDDGGDRWGSGSESEPENDDANGEDELTEEATHEARELSKQTKRMTLEIGPSSFAPRKKKKKTNAS